MEMTLEEAEVEEKRRRRRRRRNKNRISHCYLTCLFP
jgi:hypothetical protein